MRNRLAVCTMLALCCFVGTALASTITFDVPDKDITEKIVGKWNEEFDEMGIKLKATIVYKKDGTLTAEGSIDANGQTINIKVSGKWKVESGTLVETYEKVEPENLMPAGTTTKDKVLSIDDKTCTYRTEEGKERKRTRIKD